LLPPQSRSRISNVISSSETVMARFHMAWGLQSPPRGVTDLFQADLPEVPLQGEPAGPDGQLAPERQPLAGRSPSASPARDAAAIGLGLFIGCSPLIGAHRALCGAAAWMFGHSRRKLTMAANLIDRRPLVFLAVLATELQFGSWARRGQAYPLSGEGFLASLDVGMAADLLLGSILVGGALGSLNGLATFVVLLGRAHEHPTFTRLVRDAGERYLGSSVTAWEFARAKLQSDPVYRAVLTSGLVPASGRLVDVGCGQGLLLALLAQARVLARERSWPQEWSAPPADLALVGIEVRDRVATLARQALGDEACIVAGDALQVAVSGANVIVVWDVLHLLDRTAQESLVARLTAGLAPGGRILVREADAAAGWRFQATRLGNLLTAFSQGRWHARRAFRSAAAWRALLEQEGLSVHLASMGTGTQFGNVLLVGVNAAGEVPRSRTSCL
jgi:SAM-dependent methyltransferase